MLRQLRRRILIFRWRNALGLFKHRSPRSAIVKLLRIKAPDGLKQVIMVQVAMRYFEGGDRMLAHQAFREALESETSWGKRTNSNASQYIQKLCELGVRISDQNIKIQDANQFKTLITELEGINVPGHLKDDLPLPRR